MRIHVTATASELKLGKVGRVVVDIAEPVEIKWVIRVTNHYPI